MFSQFNVDSFERFTELGDLISFYKCEVSKNGDFFRFFGTRALKEYFHTKALESLSRYSYNT